MIDRTITSTIENSLFKGKTIVIYGPRQVGKTTLVKDLLEKHTGIYLNADEPDLRSQLTEATSTQLKALVGDNQLMVIDEAQRVKNIGLTLKLLHDTFPQIQVIATGSSSFELSNTIKEPLTGRTYEFWLYPLSFQEIAAETSPVETKRLLENMLRFGTYPEIISKPVEAETLLRTLTDNYLYKDALQYQDIRNSEVIDNLLRSLALQIGQEVSYSELANHLQIDLKTVRKYIRILEQSFVIFRLPPLYRNARKELTKKRKIYFWDCGIRNALIRNHNQLEIRTDTGALWENFLISQRTIAKHYHVQYPNQYFWRTWDQAEVDYVEEYSGELHGFEFKWGNKSVSAPKAWTDYYPQAEFKLINRENYQDFLSINNK